MDATKYTKCYPLYGIIQEIPLMSKWWDTETGNGKKWPNLCRLKSFDNVHQLRYVRHVSSLVLSHQKLAQHSFIPVWPLQETARWTMLQCPFIAAVLFYIPLDQCFSTCGTYTTRGMWDAVHWPSAAWQQEQDAMHQTRRLPLASRAPMTLKKPSQSPRGSYQCLSHHVLILQDSQHRSIWRCHHRLLGP